jgi:hypothetical protein
MHGTRDPVAPGGVLFDSVKFEYPKNKPPRSGRRFKDILCPVKRF